MPPKDIPQWSTSFAAKEKTAEGLEAALEVLEVRHPRLVQACGQ